MPSPLETILTVLAMAGALGLAACGSDSQRGGKDAAAGTGVDTAGGGAGGGGAGGGAGGAGAQGTGGSGGGADPARDLHLELINAAAPGGIEIKRPLPSVRFELCRGR